jgi:hypothetical protein
MANNLTYRNFPNFSHKKRKFNILSKILTLPVENFSTQYCQFNQTI